MNPNRRDLLKSCGLAALATAFPLAVAAKQHSEPSKLQASLLGIAEQAIKDMVSPGIQIAVWQEQSPIARISKGFSNLETSSGVSSHTPFRSGSLTKQFTAALIAYLHEKGKLSLQDRLGIHLDFFRGKTAPTLLELVHHTAGIYSLYETTFSTEPVTQIDLARKISEQNKLYEFSPGNAWHYSNANYILLGAVIESITNMPLAQAGKKLIFEPLGLTNTSFDSTHEIVENRAMGYSFSDQNNGTFINADYIPIEQTGGAGAMRSTADDLCLWHQSLFSGKLVSKETIKIMTAPALLQDGRPITEGRFDPNDNNMGNTSYGFGLLLDRSTKDGGLIAMHNGFVNGFSAYLATHLPSMLTIACMCNADPSQNLPFRPLRRTVFAPYFS